MPDDDPSGVSPGSVGIGTQSLDRLNKARSAACTINNMADVPPTSGSRHLDRGGFATDPPG
jgi:hypothetical protein